ncbi:hypothetical protein LCGC14_0357720 [marine sediment metagenome]|uniref:Uncharacterized protein n=1 Tax=marine sediment metagenome TaxID=412755 RepID=A0A0F9TRR6_9ZZZZ
MKETTVDCSVTSWTCYWKEGARNCGWCTHNRNVSQTSKPTPKDHYVTPGKKAVEFFEYLIDKHKLSKKAAFSVIYFLQEDTCCLPDTIEQCQWCEGLFDTNCEGIIIGAEWEWESDDVTMVMPKEFQDCYHCECVPFRECIPKEPQK